MYSMSNAVEICMSYHNFFRQILTSYLLYGCYNVFESEVECMRLNHECVRDLLLYIEENLEYDDELEINRLN